MAINPVPASTYALVVPLPFCPAVDRSSQWPFIQLLYHSANALSYWTTHHGPRTTVIPYNKRNQDSTRTRLRSILFAALPKIRETPGQWWTYGSSWGCLALGTVGCGEGPGLRAVQSVGVGWRKSASRLSSTHPILQGLRSMTVFIVENYARVVCGP
ncbi:hypothetical protein K488DRAFT_75013 [Vararia minispora EC-137]|uniref:Uncharacterized protein n=1 Tax=Vararia minispora EC-137 TaxID=1314806 RepID=A0ACB8Q5F4_9AGAM|nr:hypothetical protein K488DRAFT_75013 [Vararia minispora EC-137]